MKTPVLYMKLLELMLSRGFTNISQLAGCAELEIDKRWWVASNGHNTPIKCSRGITGYPRSFYLEFNGWPAGVIDFHGGSLAAGIIANEETLSAAVEAALQKVKVESERNAR